MNNKQEQAITLVLMGKTDAEIARKVGVTRVTVNQWRNHDLDFLSELQLRRKQLWDRQRDELIELCAKAKEILKRNMSSKDEKMCFRAAMELLRLPAMQEHLKPEKNATGDAERFKDFELRILGMALEGLEAEGKGVQPRWEEGEQRRLPQPRS